MHKSINELETKQHKAWQANFLARRTVLDVRAHVDCIYQANCNHPDAQQALLIVLEVLGDIDNDLLAKHLTMNHKRAVKSLGPHMFLKEQ